MSLENFNNEPVRSLKRPSHIMNVIHNYEDEQRARTRLDTLKQENGFNLHITGGIDGEIKRIKAKIKILKNKDDNDPNPSR